MAASDTTSAIVIVIGVAVVSHMNRLRASRRLRKGKLKKKEKKKERKNKTHAN
jgi:hypothetical protein